MCIVINKQIFHLFWSLFYFLSILFIIVDRLELKSWMLNYE